MTEREQLIERLEKLHADYEAAQAQCGNSEMKLIRMANDGDIVLSLIPTIVKHLEMTNRMHEAWKDLQQARNIGIVRD